MSDTSDFRSLVAARLQVLLALLLHRYQDDMLHLKLVAGLAHGRPRSMVQQVLRFIGLRCHDALERHDQLREFAEAAESLGLDVPDLEPLTKVTHDYQELERTLTAQLQNRQPIVRSWDDITRLDKKD